MPSAGHFARADAESLARPRIYSVGTSGLLHDEIMSLG